MAIPKAPSLALFQRILFWDLHNYCIPYEGLKSFAVLSSYEDLSHGGLGRMTRPGRVTPGVIKIMYFHASLKEIISKALPTVPHLIRKQLPLNTKPQRTMCSEFAA
jgi:hypothetical protein